MENIKNMNIDEVAKLLENWKGDNDNRGFVLMIGEMNDADLHSHIVVNGCAIMVHALVANFLKQEKSIVQQARIFEKMVVKTIESLIKRGLINPEYLEEQK